LPTPVEGYPSVGDADISPTRGEIDHRYCGLLTGEAWKKNDLPLGGGDVTT
jgi:hypothetical protein